MPPTRAPNTSEAVTVKILLVGNSSVGKSSILRRFSDPHWLPENVPVATLGPESHVRKMIVRGRTVNVRLWDTSGQERFWAVPPSYYRHANGVVVVYDVTDRNSFDALPRWFGEIEKHVLGDTATMIVGNKIDQEDYRRVPREKAQDLAANWDALFVEASAKTAAGVREAFQNLVERILDTPKFSLPRSSPEGNSVTKEEGNGDGYAKIVPDKVLPGKCW